MSTIKRILITTVLVCWMLPAIACSPEPAMIEIEPQRIYADNVDDSIVLSARVFTQTGTEIPADLLKSKIMWSSSEPEVAAIDASGNLTPKGSGEATIRAAITKPYFDLLEGFFRTSPFEIVAPAP